MEATPAMNPQPWQPFTLGGVAEFATASCARVVLVALIVAVVVSACVTWLLAVDLTPAIQAGIRRLPEQGAIIDGRLQWPSTDVALVVDHPILCLWVVPRDQGAPSPSADVQIEVNRTAIKIGTWIGHWVLPYPRGLTLALNRLELEPWWGAWKPAVLVGIATATTLGLLAVWFVLAIPYGFVVRLIAFYADRQVGILGAGRVATGALMPGALLMAGAILLYGFHQLPVIGLVFFFGLHWILGWIYLFLAPLFLPRLPQKTTRKANPFQPAGD